WFSHNVEKDKYYELLNSKTKADPKDIKKALFLRAINAITRAEKLEDEIPVLKRLQTEGVIPEEMVLGASRAIREIQLELLDIRSEAELHQPKWGQTIVSEAKNVASYQIRKEQEIERKNKEMKRMEIEKQRKAKELERLNFEAEKNALALIEEEEKEIELRKRKQKK
ncbi:hypothetical protein ROZALSC1DRAFT_13309, partial [Rozella allomycis CSF55]